MLLIDALKTARKEDPKLTLQKFAFSAFEQGRELFLGTKKIGSALDLFQADLERMTIDAPLGGKMAIEDKKAAGSGLLFNQPTVPNAQDCPHCKSRMKMVSFADKQSGVYCPTCRHADYSSNEKSHVNAGSPSVEKHLELKCTDSGHCDIKQR